jgi:hypothetical protein
MALAAAIEPEVDYMAGDRGQHKFQHGRGHDQMLKF